MTNNFSYYFQVSTNNFSLSLQEITRPNMKVPVKEPIEEILINLYWVDQYSRGSKSFETLQDFKEFLLANRELAKALGYVEKEKLKQ